MEVIATARHTTLQSEQCLICVLAVGASFAVFIDVMASQDRSRSEQIRDLITEVDRIRRESERMREDADRAMKHPIWPDRRQSPRFPSTDEVRGEERNRR